MDSVDREKEDLNMLYLTDEHNNKNEFNQNNEYINNILKELENIKLQNKKHEKARRRDRKKSRQWKLIAVLELIMLITAMVFLYNSYFKAAEDSSETFKQSEYESSSNNNNNNNNEEAIKPVSFKLIENLDEMIADVNKALNEQEENSSFTASVKELYGYEYLCFSNHNIKIYYRNEFISGADSQRDKIIIDNGSRRAEYNWDYDLTSDLTALCPYAGDFAGDGSTQLIFPFYDARYQASSEKLYLGLRFVNAATLWEYPELNLNESITGLFSLNYIDDLPENNAVEAVSNNTPYILMRITSTDYKYAVSPDSYEYAKSSTSPLDTAVSVSISLEKSRISLLSVITISDEEYLGQLTADITLDGFSYSFQTIRYGAYVKANQEDIDLGGMITPRTKPIDEYVTIHGNLGERFIIEKSQSLKRFNYDLSLLAEEGGIKTYYIDGVKASHVGIDVSKYQGNIDWKKVAGAGVEYVFIRLGFRGMNRGEGNGNLSYDENYVKNIEGALAAGLNVGVYFFSQAITIEEAVEEAQMVIEGLKGYDITYPVVFDTEAVYVNGYSARANDLTRQQRTDITKAFCETIKNAGYQPMVYANTKWMIMGIDLEQLDEYPRWFAYYGNEFAFPYDISIWQYSDSGKIPGISGNVDLNISFIDFSK